MDFKYKVSVIVPVYNVVKYLDRCLNSIVNQTLKDIEIILVDDGSKDGSSDLCDSWAKKDNRIIVIHKKNEGQGIARNIALELATGEYVACVDSDDYIELNTYELMYAECQQHNLDAAFYTYNRVNAQGEVVMTSQHRKTEIFDESTIRTYMLNLVGRKPSEYTQPHYTASASMSLYRRSIIAEHNIRFPDIRKIASEDFLFSLYFTEHAKRIGLFPYVLYHYFTNSVSTTTTYSESKYVRMIKCYEEVNRICKRNFSPKVYMPHFASYTLSLYKSIIQFETLFPRLCKYRKNKLRDICSSELMQKAFQIEETANYPFRERLIIFCMRKKLISFFEIIYFFKAYRDNIQYNWQ